MIEWIGILTLVAFLKHGQMSTDRNCEAQVESSRSNQDVYDTVNDD